MKGAMYALLVINLVLVVFVWMDVRKTRVQPTFSEIPGVPHIELLGGGSQSEVAGRQTDEQCWLFGPYQSESVAQEMRSDLLSVDYFSEVIESEEKLAPAYWVYYGPVEDKKESLKMLREFRDKKIDSFIIRREDLAGSISLGVFQNIDSARRMMRIMKGKGYETKLAEIPKAKKNFWVSVKIPVGGSLEARFDDYIEGENTRLEARQIFCK